MVRVMRCRDSPNLETQATRLNSDPETQKILGIPFMGQKFSVVACFSQDSRRRGNFPLLLPFPLMQAGALTYTGVIIHIIHVAR
jgi:hypothetical protein